MPYQLCGHCDQYLSDKTFKEHQRLYFEDERWLRLDDEMGSCSSSSIGFSLPSEHDREEVAEIDDSSCSSDSVSLQELSVEEGEYENNFQDCLGKIEYWNDNESDIEDDFPQDSVFSCNPDNLDESLEDALSHDEETVVWWLVTFTCLFQTLHSISYRAIAWLLTFLGSFLTLLSRYSNDIGKLADAFPSTLYRRCKYLKKKIFLPSVCNYVVCSTCHHLYKFEHCIENRSSQTLIRCCNRCKNKAPLLKEVVTRNGIKKYYPFLVSPNACLISSLQSMFSRPGFYHLCESWRHSHAFNCSQLSDVYNGKIWKDFLRYNSQPFLEAPNSIGLMLNIDWFQPYKHRTYSIGVIYFAIMNLPRAVRFKRENIILVGLIPGPKEPSKTTNTYLSPVVADLCSLWDGVSIKTHDKGEQVIRCALLCIGCDLPAGRKVAGFLSYSANLGCSRCFSNFGTGIFGKQNYSGFNRSSWVLRTNEKHRESVQTILSSSTKTQQRRLESELGCRYSCLLRLPYFDPVRMLTIDPMHNLYLGSAKHLFSEVWVRNGVLDSNKVKVINERVLCLVIPTSVRFNGLPACLDYPSSLTAEQWMLWVNYYSVYCLYGLIPSMHLECWRNFVLASRILSQRHLTEDEIDTADQLLMRFCTEFESLYGEFSVTPNIHLHPHLVECIRDHGPMSSFWLFSFERFNGILGDEPTNNRSIEVQLMTRFLQDNSHLQLLNFMPNEVHETVEIFSHAIQDHASTIASSKHLDTADDLSVDEAKILPANKYTVWSFSEPEQVILRNVYSEVFSSIYASVEYFPYTFKKMSQVAINGQMLRCGQYVLAKSVFNFSSSQTSFELRPAKIRYVFMHSVQVSEGTYVNQMFAYVLCHPFRHNIGKPYEIWCVSAFETCDTNVIIPVCNITNSLLTAQQIISDERVLVTVPLIT